MHYLTNGALESPPGEGKCLDWESIPSIWWHFVYCVHILGFLMSRLSIVSTVSM